jgi:hypothetical protein
MDTDGQFLRHKRSGIEGELQHFAKSSTFTAPVSTYNFQTLKFSGTLDAVEGEAAREINEPSVMQTERGFIDNWQEAGSN